MTDHYTTAINLVKRSEQAYPEFAQLLVAQAQVYATLDQNDAIREQTDGAVKATGDTSAVPSPPGEEVVDRVARFLWSHSYDDFEKMSDCRRMAYKVLDAIAGES